MKSQYIGYCKITIKCIINATKLKCEAEEDLDFESLDAIDNATNKNLL